MEFVFSIIALLIAIWIMITIKAEESLKNKRLVKILSIGIILFVAFQCIVTFPFPRTVYIDGEAIEMKKMMSETQNSNTYFVTVGSKRVNNLKEKYYWEREFKAYNPTFSNLLETAFSILTPEQNRIIEKLRLEESIPKMYIVANKEAGNQVKYDKRLEVGSVFRDNLTLKEGDQILSLNNIEFNDRDKLIYYLKNNQHENLEIKFIRDKKEKIMELELADELTGIASLGFWLTEKFKLEEDLKSLVNTEGLIDGGGSAGLMMALQLYLELTDKQISSDIIVAGTGAIDENGTVEKIGGVDHKVNAANKKGANIFFVPTENYDEALEQQMKIGAEKMKIVQVKTLHQVIEYLGKDII